MDENQLKTDLKEVQKKYKARDIHEMTMDETGFFGIDDDKQLYWYGNKVEFEKKISLGLWEKLAIILGGLGAFVSSIVYFLEVLWK